MYGKIENMAVTVAPREIDGVVDPPEEVYIAHGWFPIVFTNQPGSDYEPGWEQVGKTIVQTWTLVPLPDEVDDAEAFDIIFGGAE